MSSEVDGLKNLDEFDYYLAKGQLILKRCVEKLGYKFSEGSKEDIDRHGREFFLSRDREKISINLERIPSSNHQFEIICDDKGKPITLF